MKLIPTRVKKRDQKLSYLVKRNCPRCNKETLGLRKPFIKNTDSLFEKMKGVCNGCITREEENEILHTQARALQKMAIDNSM